MSDYQLDALARRAASTLDRRGSLKALAMAAVALGFILGETPWSVHGQGEQGQRQGARERERQAEAQAQAQAQAQEALPPELQTCSGGACGAEPKWAGKQCQINHCEFICRQCDGDDPREFCIRKGAKRDGTPTKVADCCREGETSPALPLLPRRARVLPRGTRGIVLPQRQTCCSGTGCPTNNPWTACCAAGAGHGIHKEHCGACGNACLPNERCSRGTANVGRDCAAECRRV